MKEKDLSTQVAAWMCELKYASSSIKADVRDALERSESEADFLREATVPIQQLLAECQGNLQWLASFRGEATWARGGLN